MVKLSKVGYRKQSTYTSLDQWNSLGAMRDTDRKLKKNKGESTKRMKGRKGM